MSIYQTIVPPPMSLSSSNLFGHEPADEKELENIVFLSITSLYSFLCLTLPTVKTGQLCNVFCIVGGIRLFTSYSGLYSAFLSHFIGRLNSRYAISVSSLHRKFVAARHVTQSKHCHPILSPIHCNLELKLDTFVTFPTKLHSRKLKNAVFCLLVL